MAETNTTNQENFSAEMTLLPFGLAGLIYRTPMPFRQADADGKLFAQYVQADVKAVVVLAQAEECWRKTGRDLLQFYAQQGLYVIHCPISDFQTPEATGSLNAALNSVLRLAQNGQAVAVHCYAGIGRTGLFMACLARLALGLPGEQAVAWVRQYIPGALENDAQVRYVVEFC